MINKVHPANDFRIIVCILASVWPSMEAVASSITNTLVFRSSARAMQINCLSPAEKLVPELVSDVI
jgi:hypothetical protein